MALSTFALNRFVYNSCIKQLPLKHSLINISRYNLNLKLPQMVLYRRSATIVRAEPMKHISDGARKCIGAWLLTCGGITFLTITIGGITRLTRSGLSMVEWHLFKEFPPLSQSQWQLEFEKYKIRNTEMTLEEFKWIWFMEYAHRTLGRTIGAMFAIPAAVFWYKKWFNSAMKKRIIAFGTLLVFQGLLGWYMVKSGLEDNAVTQRDPRVSHYRLAAHLGVAFVFYSLLLYSGLSHILPPLPTEKTRKMLSFRRYAHATKGLIFLTALSGALVAGLDAGLIYNSFPKMGDHWIPQEILKMTPLWKNFTENTTTVQFDHRILGELVFCAVTGCWVYSQRLPLNSRTRLAINCLMIVGIVQVGFGIANLLFYVPKPLAAAHQTGGLTLLSTVIWLTHELKCLPK